MNSQEGSDIATTLKNMKASLPFITVVVPHRGPTKQLKQCVSALNRQTYPRDRFEILVVINGPVSQTARFDSQPNVKVLEQSTGYSYAARNKAITEAQGSMIGLLDSDTKPDPHWLEAGAEAMSTGSGLVAGRIKLTFRTSPLSPSACYEKVFSFDQEKNVRIGRSVTANLFVQSNLFVKYGLFAQDAVSGEDFAWTSRAVLSGEKLTYASSVVVEHPARETLWELLIKAKRDANVSVEGGDLREDMRLAFSRWKSRYLFSPSQQRIADCSPRELILGASMGLVIQLMKASIFLFGLVNRSLQEPGELTHFRRRPFPPFRK